MDKLLGLFDEEPYNVIIQIPLPLRSRPDKPACIVNSKGEFSMRSAYNIYQSRRFTQVDEEALGSPRNLNIHERFEAHASASLKRNVSNDECQAVKEASESLRSLIVTE